MKTLGELIQEEALKELDRIEMKFNRAENLRQNFHRIAKTPEVQAQLLAGAIATQVVVTSIKDALMKLLESEEDE